jgi:8-oxo-dGTP pyrophosphatase MutT (NUDIX family)
MDEEKSYFGFKRDARGEQYITCDDEVLILPVDAQGAVIFSVEPAAAFGEDVLILPGGTVEAGESLSDTANRELQEELGLRAGRLEYLGEVRPWSKYLAVRSHIFLGRDLVPSRLAGDEGYEIGTTRVPWSDLDALVTSGRLRDARAIAGLYLARAAMAASAPHPSDPARRRGFLRHQ